jgi:hypothetical protein
VASHCYLCAPSSFAAAHCCHVHFPLLLVCRLAREQRHALSQGQQQVQAHQLKKAGSAQQTSNRDAKGIMAGIATSYGQCGSNSFIVFHCPLWACKAERDAPTASVRNLPIACGIRLLR